MPIQEYRSSAYAHQTGAAYIYLLVLEHDDLDEPIYVTNGKGEWDPQLRTYTRRISGHDYFANFPFEIEIPGQSDEQLRGHIRIQNIDQRFGKAIDTIYGPPTVGITCVLESNPLKVMGGPYNLLNIQNVKGDALVIEGDLTWPQLTELLWPKGWIRPGKYLAAFYATA